MTYAGYRQRFTRALLAALWALCALPSLAFAAGGPDHRAADVVAMTAHVGTVGGVAETAASQAAEAGPEPTSGLVNNVFADEDLRQVLRDIAAQTGATIMPDQSVQGIVSVEIRDMPLEKALKLVLFSNGYVYKYVDGCYLVGSADPNSPTFSTLCDKVRLRLINAQATEVFNLLSRAYQAYVQADPATNTMVVIAPEPLLHEIVQTISMIDQVPDQVMIEVMVVDVNANAARDMGIKWRWESFGFDVGDPQNLSATDTQNRTGGAVGNTISFIDATVTDLVNLRLLLTKEHATIRANPRVSTLNGREAEIFVGREQYFTVTTGSAYYANTQLQQVKAGITLKIRPFVGPDGKLTINIDPEVSDVIGMTDNGAPIIATRRVHSSVRCEDGGTIVLGGLTQVINQLRKSRVPVLSEIPLIGNLFRQSSTSSTETEIVIFLRPHILEGNEASNWTPADIWPEVPTYTQRQETREQSEIPEQ